MEASESQGSDQPKRGEIGRQTYEMVQALISDGKKATEAFAEVADRTGRSAATVATAYYRTARQMPGGGGVRQRPRRGRAQRADGAATTATPRASRQSRTSTQSLVRDLQNAANALAK